MKLTGRIAHGLHWRLDVLRERLRRPPRCSLCGGRTDRRAGYGRTFFACRACGFIFATDYNPGELSQGMGMEGSWSGPGGGGFREYFLVHLLMKDLGCKRFLLYGTGNTTTFGKLREEGVDATGCDISPDVVAYKKAHHGDDTFFTPAALPAGAKFDAIVSVEVFEHLMDPRAAFTMLTGHLNPGGVLCGTTNFHPGGPIEDSNDPGYMSLMGHVAYWSLRSMGAIARQFGREVAAFEMIRPGSVLPDEKFGQLWPNKRVFFIYEPAVHGAYFAALQKSTPILPIDHP